MSLPKKQKHLLEQLNSVLFWKLLFFLSSAWYFAPGFIRLGRHLLDPIFYEKNLMFVVIVLLWLGLSFKKQVWRSQVSSAQQNKIALGLMLVAIIFSANYLRWHLQVLYLVIPPIVAYLLAGLWLEKRWWQRSIFVAGLLMLTLPVLERLQRFVGFPLRLFSADVVGGIFDWMGIAHVSRSTIIVSENNIASIDLPCSGVKSLYTGSIFMLLVYWLQEVRLSWRLMISTLVFWIALIAANIWRIFSLIYIYSVLGLKQQGDQLHVTLGLVGFILSCVLLWWMIKKHAEKTKPKQKKNKIITAKKQQKTSLLLQLTTVTLLAASILLNKHNKNILENTTTQPKLEWQLENLALTPIPFTQPESEYFATQDVAWSGKFVAKTQNGKPYSVLIVASTSARTHHEPEICIQGIGHKLDDSQVVQVGDLSVKELSLNKGEDKLLYWFISHDQRLFDPSERVWEDIQNPGKLWVLVQIGVKGENDLDEKELAKTIKSLDKEIMLQLRRELKKNEPKKN